MQTILETRRLTLREMAQADYKDLAEILQDEQCMYAYEHAFSDEEVQTWLDKQLARYREDGFGLWAVLDKESGRFVGQVGLTIQDVDGVEELEIGYLLKRKYWHLGYATEAALGCKNYAFNVLGRERVVSIIRDTNLASQKVALRTGMQVERSFIKHYHGMDMLHYLFAVLKPEAKTVR